MNQTLIKNGYILSMNAKGQIYDGGDILVEGDTLKAVGKVPAEMISEDVEVVDAAGKIIMPGKRALYRFMWVSYFYYLIATYGFNGLKSIKISSFFAVTSN
jgi:cytosine/adenosine deaminase-related metal-dependent hydrolase